MRAPALIQPKRFRTACSTGSSRVRCESAFCVPPKATRPSAAPCRSHLSNWIPAYQARNQHLLYRGNRVQYSVIGVDGRARRTVDIEVAGSPMMDNLSLTERHVVFYDLPVTFDTRRGAAMMLPPGLRLPARLLLSALVGRVRIPDPISARTPNSKIYDHPFPYWWNPKHPARVGVMPRRGSNADVRWFDVEPCYVFHPMNAYDDGDTIVLDVVRAPEDVRPQPPGAERGPVHTGPLDRRSRRRHGARIALRRSWAGVSPRGRTPRRQAASVRLCARWRSRLRQHPAQA